MNSIKQESYILSIDPGISNCGISILDIDKNFTVIDSLTVKNQRKFTPEEKELELKVGTRTVKVLNILNAINMMLNKYSIKFITIEAPFYSALSPAAYGSLLEVIFSIKYTICLPKAIEFKLIEPLLVKKMFSNHSLASKDIIKQFLIKKLEDKDIIMTKHVDELTEHEIDSIAVGYVYFLSLKQGGLTCG